MRDAATAAARSVDLSFVPADRRRSNPSPRRVPSAPLADQAATHCDALILLECCLIGLFVKVLKHQLSRYDAET